METKESFLQKQLKPEDSLLNWSSKVKMSLNYMAKQERPILFTDKEFVGSVCYSEEVKIGDIVCILLGCPIPMVLRPVDDHYLLIGDIYLDGVMYGEAIKLLNKGKTELQDFVLH